MRACAGLDVVVLDHHLIHGPPVADAIVVSAQLPGGAACTRPLGGRGRVPRSSRCLAREGCRVDGIDGEPETALLDLVALGTIADMVPLAGINRALVRDGRVLRRGRRRGSRSNSPPGGRRPRDGDRRSRGRSGWRRGSTPPVGWATRARPRSPARRRPAAGGAAGRCPGAVEQRAQGRSQPASSTEAEGDHRRHGRGRPAPGRRPRPGVAERGVGVGGGAARRAVRPTGDRARRRWRVSHGSARSVPGFDIAGALDGCRELLGRFGGHAQAAGVALPTAAIPALEAALAAALDEQGIAVPILPALRLHADLPAERLALETAFLLDHLQPFGMGNEQPIVRVRELAVRQYDVIGRTAATSGCNSARRAARSRRSPSAPPSARPSCCSTAGSTSPRCLRSTAGTANPPRRRGAGLRAVVVAFPRLKPGAKPAKSLRD